MSELEELKTRIEESREELHKLAENSNTPEQELLNASQVLDVTINKYYLLLARETAGEDLSLSSR
ncbi:MAG TPA: aspartyl-phosphate phosphatase Spo0E family protein [Spirochaetia bacterium]|nr:aspartyl-phosphate phosphatase Spo0E family protein [Spirochaetia bacterium]